MHLLWCIELCSAAFDSLLKSFEPFVIIYGATQILACSIKLSGIMSIHIHVYTYRLCVCASMYGLGSADGVVLTMFCDFSTFEWEIDTYAL